MSIEYVKCDLIVENLNSRRRMSVDHELYIQNTHETIR